MFSITVLPLLLTASPVATTPSSSVPTASPAPVVVQDDAPDELPDKRPEIKELCKQLTDHAKKKGDEDADAIKVIDQLFQEFEQSGPKDRESIVKALEGCLKQKRKQNDEGEWDNNLYLAAAVSLGHMGPESVDVLVKQLGNKAHKKNLYLKRQILLSLGKTTDEGAAEEILDMLKDKDQIVVAAAAEALGEYHEAEQKLRKELVEGVLKELMPRKNAIDNDSADEIAREWYDAISGPCITTLQRLTGQELRSPEDFRTWWNKNKKEDWDEEA